MKCSRIVQQYKIGQTFRIIPLSDIHLGNRLCSKRHLREVVESYRKDKDARFILLGDQFDGIFVGDKRYQATMIDPDHVGKDAPIDLAIAELAEILMPIRNRIIACLEGNHESTVTQRGGTDMTHRLLWALFCRDQDGAKKVESLRYGYAGFLGFALHRENSGSRCLVSMYLCHGLGGGGKTEGGFATSIGNNAKFYRADVQLYGHNHRLGGWDNIVIEPDQKWSHIVSTKEIRLNCGTFLKGFSDDFHTSYSEKAQYKPNELGHMVLEITALKNEYRLKYWKESFV